MANQEQKLTLVSKVVGDKTFYNLNLKSKPLKGIVGLENGNYIIVTKTKFAEGREIPSKFENSKLFSCLIEYDGKECSTVLNEKEHTLFKNAGGVGDKVKITLNKEPYVNPKTGVEMILNKLVFARV